MSGLDCEQNDLGIIEVPSSNLQYGNSKGKVMHQKTKSEGTTPSGASSIQSQFYAKSQLKNVPIMGVVNQQNQILDYQKFLKGEQIVHHQKHNSIQGYYSQQNTPMNNNNTGRQTACINSSTSKTPDLINQLALSQYNSSGNPSQKTPGSQSALNHYPNAIIMNQISNRQIMNQQQQQQQQQARSNSRRKNNSSTHGLGYQQQMQIKTPDYMMMQKRDEILDPLNEASVNESTHIIYDDQYGKVSNNGAQRHGKGQQQQMNRHVQSQEENYLDSTSIYDHYMQGPHNISHQSSKLEDISINSYGAYVGNNNPKQKFIRASSAQKQQCQFQKGSQHPQQQQQQQQQQQDRNSKRSGAQTVQHSLNNSGQKNQNERRLLMGRTPSPNFLKRIANLMQFGGGGNENIFFQNIIQQSNSNNSTTKNTSKPSHSQKRSHSKQQYQSDGGLNNGKILIGQHNVLPQSLNNSLKNKFIKQSSLQGIKYKGQSITTANTAKHSPSRTSTNTPSKQRSLKKPLSNNPTQVQLDSLGRSQVDFFNQKQLKIINALEERKALALVSSINSTSKNKAESFKQHLQQQRQLIGEILEEEPQPVSSHEFGTYIQESQQIYNQPSKKLTAKGQSKQILDGGTGSNGVNVMNTHNSTLSKVQSYENQQQVQIVQKSLEQQQIQHYIEQLSHMKKVQSYKNNYIGNGHRFQSNETNTINCNSPDSINQTTPQQAFSHIPRRKQTDDGVVQREQEFPAGKIRQNNNIDDNKQQLEEQKVQVKRKIAQVIEPPKIKTPSIDMYQSPEMIDKNKVQKKGQVINFIAGKTPFELELEQKSIELQKQKKGSAEDSLSILKQLQESETYKDLPIQCEEIGIDDETKSIEQIQVIDPKKKQQYKVNPPKQQKSSNRFNEEVLDHMNKMIDEEPVLMTEEDERQIKEIASDINEKAFYGKILRKTVNVKEMDENMSKLSPRSREIASVMKIIQKSFKDSNEPPITTTDFYRIGKMLGRGAFGKVNLAMHKLVRKLVAIKSLNKECLTDEAQKAKLMKEVSLLLKLRHNHVVKIYETIETEKHIIIVMELCAGGDLLNYVRKRRRLKEPYAKLIFKQIIDGLCYIHSKYIAHRDIKLDNILLDGKGSVKIGDFGVSKQCQKGQMMNEQCGTPAYIAPEILRDKGYTFNVDIWSAGVVLFAMLYGTVPFKANNMEELHKLIIKGKYTLKDDISAEARNLLRGLLEVNPEKRLTIEQIYRHKWLQDVDPNLQLFNDLERDMIKKEYTYNDPRRYNRNENEEPVDCFTEHNLESVYNSLKNATSKSVILAPFNSTQSQIDVVMRESVQELVCEKMMVLNFARRCREIDRQYEFNNNGELDNGVYHKFVYNSDEDDDESDENKGRKQNAKEQLSEQMLVSVKQKTKKGGRASIENSFENDMDIEAMQERQKMAKIIKDGSQINKEMIMRNNRAGKDLDIDEEMVRTFETFQSKFNTDFDEDKIQKLVEFGYPREYVINTLEENDPNHCTSGYYLMVLDQNYC